MRIECKQCGAGLAVTSPDAYLSCPYCGARSVVTDFKGSILLHRPALTAQDASRLFPSKSVASVSLFWFPFDPASLKGVFTQPYSEMEGYTPPAADRRLWEDEKSSGTVIPADPDLTGDEGILYHPFWVVIDSETGNGRIVDAVSGGIVGEGVKQPGEQRFDPFRTALAAFLLGLAPAFAVFFLVRGLSLFLAPLLSVAAAVFTGEYLRRKGHLGHG